MKIGVVGSFVLDTIITGSSETSCLGGIAYNLISLAQAFPNAEIIPVATVDPGVRERLPDITDKYPNINAKHLVPTKRPGHRNTIFLEPGRRTERFEPGQSNLSISHLEALMDADGVVINMITPWDLSIETGRSFAARFRSRIHLDVHSLVRRLDPDAGWVIDPKANKYMWIRVADTLQMNQEEARAFTGLEVQSPDDAKKACMLMVLSGPQACAITLGPDGAAVAQRNQQGVQAKHLPAPDRSDLDMPGCGDVFSSWFFRALIHGKDALSAAEDAVKKATYFAKKTEVYHGHERG